MRRITTVSAVLCLALSLSAAGTARVSKASPTRAPGLAGARFSAADRAQVLDRLQHTDATLQRVLLLGRAGHGTEISNLVRGRGGRVRLVDDRAGYVDADLPSDEALALQGQPELVGLALDRQAGQAQPDPAPREADSAEGTPAPGSVSPDALDALFPTSKIGAPQFVRAHPRFDGRGVRIAILDTLADWGAPGLQTTSTGGRKITKKYDPVGGDDYRIATEQVVEVARHQFTVAGRTYELPANPGTKTVRFGLIQESTGALLSDLNLDGDTSDAYPTAVIDTGRHGVVAFVDTDQDGSFVDEKRLSDWNSSHSTATFGHDDPSTRNVVEVRQFGLNQCQTSGTGACQQSAQHRGDRWNVVLGTATSDAAATAAGNDMPIAGRHVDGVAAGAELWYVNPFGPSRPIWGSTFATALIFAARLAPDVIDLPTTLSTFFFPGQDDVLSGLVDNVVDGYRIPVVTSASGQPGLGLVTTAPQASRKGLVVGAYIAPETYAALFGKPGVGGERLWAFSGAGHGIHGRTARPLPDVLAPSPTLASRPLWLRPSGAIAGHLPVGYGAGPQWGLASAQASGVLALLISAARAERLPYSPHALARAVELGARPLRGDEPYTRVQAGHGLVQVERAWWWLQRLVRHDGAADRGLAATATADVPSGAGQSIYQRGTVRDHEVVSLASTDTRARTYRLSADQPWVRFDREHLDVPGAIGATTTTTFRVEIDPSVRQQAGVHAATVTLDDPSTVDPADYDMPITIVTPLRFDAAAGNRVHVTGAGATGIPAEATREIYVDIPAGTQQLLFEHRLPVGQAISVDYFYPSPSGDLLGERDPAPNPIVSSTLSHPTPGVLGITMWAHETNRPQDQPVVPRHAYDLTLTVVPAQ